MPTTSGDPSGTNASTTNPKSTRPTARLDQLARLKTRWEAVEALLLVQSHRAQGGTYGPCPRSEDRASQEHLSVPKDALGEQWHEREQNPYHLGG